MNTPDYTNQPPPTPGSTARRRVVALCVVGAILLVGGIGLNGAVASMKLSFKKLPVPLRQKVQTIPAELGPWVQTSREERFSEEIEAELGTLDYIDRWYVDLRKADAALRREWESTPAKSDDLKRRLQENVARNDPFAAVKVHLAYYTGAVDTVPHIPDRCMVAGGFDPAGQAIVPLDLGEGRSITSSFVQFERKAGMERPLTFSVAYFFQVNGDYEFDAITGVRKRLQNLFEKYGYFAKIELMTAAPEGDADRAQEAMGRFLHDAMPAIERALPDWDEVMKRDPEADRAAQKL